MPDGTEVPERLLGTVVGRTVDAEDPALSSEGGSGDDPVRAYFFVDSVLARDLGPVAGTEWNAWAVLRTEHLPGTPPIADVCLSMIDPRGLLVFDACTTWEDFVINGLDGQTMGSYPVYRVSWGPEEGPPTLTEVTSQ